MRFCYILTVVSLCTLTGFLAYTEHLFLAFLSLIALSGVKLNSFGKNITIETDKEHLEEAKKLLSELSETDKTKVRIKITENKNG
ncbi:hypothetical protein [Succinivibrio dextrinosolvens]|jgi:predicted tellurium resistance membrane protein TerC|uniref:hypothetical protein n=1 Tax=Succinivibrio dextrinosolvens TaxID=83771 RepID=UPI00241F2F3A|nr:hypothetical protein [Succinivibrio dextrinosolvens]MBE6423043.1 hypothetical protein [Succinivibrio dextrinosolvens]